MQRSEIVVDHVASVERDEKEKQMTLLDTIRKPNDPMEVRDDILIDDDMEDNAETFGLCTNLDALPNEEQEMAAALIKTTDR